MDQFNLFKTLIKNASEARGIKEYEVYYSTSSDIGADTYQDEINTFPPLSVRFSPTVVS